VANDLLDQGRKRLSEESVVISDSTMPQPTNLNTTKTFSYQPIAPHPIQSTPSNEVEHATQTVFCVEPLKRKKTNRKKKDHDEESQLVDIGSMVLGPMGPSFELLPSLRVNFRSHPETRERQNSPVDSTMSQSRSSSSRHQIECNAERDRRVDLTGPEHRSRGSSQSVPPRPLTDEGGLSVRSMVMGPMGPSFTVFPSFRSNSRSRERHAVETQEHHDRTVVSTERQPRDPSSRLLPLRPQEHASGTRERQVKNTASTETQPRDSSFRSMPPRRQIEHGAEIREQWLRTVDFIEPEVQSRAEDSRPLPPRPPANDRDLEKYVSSCWDVACTSCRSYSLHP